MNTGGSPTINPDQRNIEQLARLFNIVFNSALLYGGDHPTTRKNIDPFYDTLQKVLQTLQTVTVMVERGNLFFEDWCVDKIINPKRIIIQFEKLGIMSVTFNRAVRFDEAVLFFHYSSDKNPKRDAEGFEKKLRDAGCQNIRLNYVRLSRITDDQAVIGKDAAHLSGESGSSSRAEELKTLESFTGTVLHELGNVLSLKKLLEQPSQVSEQFSRAALDPASAPEVQTLLKNLSTQVSSLPESPATGSLDNLLNAVYELKADLQDAIQVQKATGKFLENTSPVQIEMASLTCEVIVKLVKEEYHKGEISVKRLANIIRRMLPDIQELKHFLPRLKTMLLAEGMALGDYLALIRELNVELESDRLAQALQDASAQSGLTVEDIVAGMKADPGDAARLIVLASEIRQGAKQDETQLSTLLTDYVEKISSHLALNSHETSGEQGGKLLRNVVAKLENQLMERLKDFGLTDSLMQQVKGQLTERFGNTLDNVTAKWMVNIVPTDRATPISDVAGVLEKLIDKESQLAGLRNPLTAALGERGYSPEQVESFFKIMAARVSAGTLQSELPLGVLSSNNTLYFLNREIKQHQRYKSDFSVIALSILCVKQFGAPHLLSQQSFWGIRPRLLTIIRTTLRDLDLVGSLGKVMENTTIVILPMTGEQGAKIVCKRLTEKISSIAFNFEESESLLEPILSITSPTDENTESLKSFIEFLKNTHGENIHKFADGAGQQTGHSG